MVRIQKLSSTNAFVALDLEGSDMSSGPVRWARKILQGGAKDLARSQTYTYAVLGMKMGGASAGISADADNRDEAVAAFVTEMAELVADGTYLPDAAKGVSESDLGPLRDPDPRDTARCWGDIPTFADRCEALSIATCAEWTLGGLDGRSAAIDGSGPVADALGELVSTRGAKLLAGPGVADDAVSALDSGADVVFVGSKMGVINHTVAARLSSASVVVPCGRIPITARALAVLRRGGTAVPADFVALAGSTVALWSDPDRSESDIESEVSERVGAMSMEFAGHSDGPFLAACLRAEDFLDTWQDELPFGRPLAP